MKKQAILLLAILSIALSAYSQTGPGGVGNSSTNELWLKADDITGINPDSALSVSWTDASGNSHDASQSTPAYRPTYQSSGGIASVRFDGVNDYLDNTYSYTARTVFVVYNVKSTLMLTTDLGQIWGNYQDGAHIAMDARAANLKGFSFDGQAGGTTAKYALNGSTYSGFVANSNVAPYAYDVTQLISTEFNANKAMTRQVIGSLYPQFPVGDHQYGGDISEMVVYNTTLNTAQRILVDNYLAAKYNITMAANDYYAYQATHKNDLIGVGRVDASNTHTTATAANFLTITSGAGLDANGEFLLAAHNGSDATSWAGTEVPDASYERIAREWRFDETGDLGTVTLTIDTATLDGRSANFTTFMLLVDADGDFSNGATSYQLTYVSGTTFSVDIDITDGSFVTIAAFKPEVQFQITSASGAEAVGTDSMIIELATALNVDVTVDYAVTGGSATGSGTDFTLASGTATILAGTTSTAVLFTVNNDTDLESTENFVVTLSNPTNAVLGTNTTHTYSINDDDASRNIEFTTTTGTGSEGTSTVNVEVRIDSVDNSNDISVNYAVTGGTATGSGTDYTLASGTATIFSGDTVVTFSITINDDALDENNETIIVLLSNPTNANIGTKTTYTYTITDNDAAPNVAFSQSTTGVGESVGVVNLAVNLSAVSALNVTVNYTLGGTATNGVDYTVAGSSVIIPAGSSSTNIAINITDDSSYEPSETIVTTITTAVNATKVSPFVNTITIAESDALGTGGPGGIGDASSNPLWLKADDIVGISNGATLTTTWADASGNSNGASQSTAAYQPTYYASRVNGKPALAFDGTNDYLDNNKSYNARTIFIVFNTSSANQDPIELAQLWGSYAEGVQVALDPRAGTNVNGYSFDGNAATTAKYSINDNTFGAAVANGNTVTWSYDTWNILTVQFTSTQAVTRQVIGSLVPQFTVGTHQFGGDIAEIIVYSDTLGKTRRSIVQNYLAAKYDITISNDLYSYESTHGDGLIGIGSVDGVQNHYTSESSDVMAIGSASSMDSGDYLLIGHNGADVDSFSSVGMPYIPGASRVAREWRVAEIGNIGTVDISIDTTALPTKPVGQDHYLLFVYDDEEYIDGISIYKMTLSGGKYVATGLDLNDGDYMTVVAASNISSTSGDFNTGANWASGSVPVTGQPAIITAGQTLTLSDNATVGSVLVSVGATLELGTSNISIDAGDYFNGGYVDAGTGTMSFTATTNQNITTYFDPLYNVTMNGAGGTTVLDELEVENTLTLTNGVVTTGSNRVYVSNPSASALSGGSSSSFINGILRREIDTNTDTYVFPVGNGVATSNYYYAHIINGNMAGVNYLTASFVPLANHDDADLNIDDNGFVVSTIKTEGVWRIDPNMQPSSGNYGFIGATTNFTGLVDNEFIVVKRPSGSLSGADWTTANGKYNTENGYGRMVADGEAMLLELTSFSEFGGGGGSGGGGSLPIELLYFNATMADNHTVALTWSTAVEVNNEHFTVERSTDGVHFEEILERRGAGNSSVTLYYDAIDVAPASGVNYYRLKQTDFDGKFEYSVTVAVNNITDAVQDFSIYPNPVSGNSFTIGLDPEGFNANNEDNFATVKIINVLGEVVSEHQISSYGDSQITLPTGLTEGIYMLQLSLHGEVTSKLFIYK